MVTRQTAQCAQQELIHETIQVLVPWFCSLFILPTYQQVVIAMCHYELSAVLFLTMGCETVSSNVRGLTS